MPSSSRPVEPPPTRWQLPSALEGDEHGLVGVGADLEPGTVLGAYRRGLFPMPLGERGPLGWWAPDPRGVLPLDGLRVSRSLRRSCRRYEVRIDTAFDDVIEACRALPRGGSWISPEISDAYVELHRLGWAHSVESWTPDGTLAGGLYGIAIGGFFAGESMFQRRTDASKVALVSLVGRLRDAGAELLDVQWRTEHLATLGVVDIPLRRYLERLDAALAVEAHPF